MNIFKSKKRSVSITDKDPTYKVRYLGNVQTALMKGEGCVDKPIKILWNNFIQSANSGLDMKLTISAVGLKAQTKDQGLTEYRAHRISYYIAHTSHPRLFAWVYRHEGRKMKVELRCHAVLCKSETMANVLAVQLHEKLSLALKEFLKEKIRNQNTRLILQRTNSLPKSGSVVPLRKQFLSTGQQYKPPVSSSNKAPKLGSISEEDIIEEEISDDESMNNDVIDNDSESLVENFDKENPLEVFAESLPENVNSEDDIDMLSERILECRMMTGNDIDKLKHDSKVQLKLQSSQSSESDEDSNGNSVANKNEDINKNKDFINSDSYTDRRKINDISGLDVMVTAF